MAMGEPLPVIGPVDPLGCPRLVIASAPERYRPACWMGGAWEAAEVVPPNPIMPRNLAANCELPAASNCCAN